MKFCIGHFVHSLLIPIVPGLDADLGSGEESEDEESPAPAEDPFEAAMRDEAGTVQQQDRRESVQVVTSKSLFSFPSAPKKQRKQGAGQKTSGDQRPVEAGGSGSLNLTREAAEKLSFEELLKAKLVKELLKDDDKKAADGDEDDSKADWVKITGQITVTFPNGRQKVIKIDEGGPDADVNKVSLEARHYLRCPQGKPSQWWKQVDGLNKSMPVRGSGLNLSSSMGSSRIHEKTIKVMHSRTSAVNHKW